MRDNYILTAESVTEGHPDKLCDTIADAVLDAFLLGNPDSRVACEVLATAGKITVAGSPPTPCRIFPISSARRCDGLATLGIMRWKWMSMTSPRILRRR